MSATFQEMVVALSDFVALAETLEMTGVVAATVNVSV